VDNVVRDVCCLSEIDGLANRHDTKLLIPITHPHKLQQVNTLRISDHFENHYLVGNSLTSFPYFQHKVTGLVMAGWRTPRLIFCMILTHPPVRIWDDMPAFSEDVKVDNYELGDRVFTIWLHLETIPVDI
jgi:hypothetical protein